MSICAAARAAGYVLKVTHDRGSESKGEVSATCSGSFSPQTHTIILLFFNTIFYQHTRGQSVSAAPTSFTGFFFLFPHRALFHISSSSRSSSSHFCFIQYYYYYNLKTGYRIIFFSSVSSSLLFFLYVHYVYYIFFYRAHATHTHAHTG